MKKVITIILALALMVTMMLSMSVTSFAAGPTLTNTGAATVAEGATTTITFLVKGATISSGSVEVSCSSDLEIVSGKWLLSGTMMADYKNGKGAAAFTGAKAVNGNYFQVTVKGKNISKAATVTLKAELKNGSTSVGKLTSTKTISVICKSHKFSDWKTVDPTCTAAGQKTRTCSVCGTVEKQSIAALGHEIKGAEIIKKATCTESGSEKGTCTRCGKTVTQTIAAKGHDYGSWVVVTQSTCSEAGSESRSCKACGKKETRKAALAAHDFGGSQSVEREATISVPGLVSGTCTKCGEYAEQEIPCELVDNATGVSFNAEEGVFLPGTEIKVEKLGSEVPVDKAHVALKGLGKYEAFSIEALVSGANVQPNGDVEVTFAIPDGFGENIAVVYVDDEGKIEYMGTVVNGDGTVTATLKHFSTYAVVSMGSAGSGLGGLGGGTQEGLGGLMLYIAIGEAAVIVLLIILLAVKGKKRA